MNFIIQASSRSWVGDKEHCMYLLDEYPAIYWTIKRIYDNFKNVTITIIAPEYDKNGDLEDLKKFFKNLKIFYGFDENPLLRMIEVTKSLNSSTHYVRINALNFLFDINDVYKMYEMAERFSLDCIKFKDDFPVHFTFEIYKTSAIRMLYNMILNNEIENYELHHVHPKFILMRLKEFNTQYYTPINGIDDMIVRSYREKMKQIMYVERQNIENINTVEVGNQLSFHYELAKFFLEDKNIKKGRLLDIACGTAKGLLLFVNYDYELVGADYDLLLIEDNKQKYSDYNINFIKEDITQTTFESESFDIILTMETFEHIEPNKMLKELKRILKKDGYIILSTPQNSYNGICINPEHLYEYSLDEFSTCVSNYFEIQKIIGLKAGRIYFDDDPIGANTMIFAKNAKILEDY